MKITYKTQGTCSSHIEVEVENGVIQQVFFWGGCNGNLQGISRLIKGMKVEEISVELDRDYRYTKKLIKKSIKKYAEI